VSLFSLVVTASSVDVVNDNLNAFTGELLISSPTIPASRIVVEFGFVIEITILDT
jgi:hypothetical protein